MEEMSGENLARMIKRLEKLGVSYVLERQNEKNNLKIIIRSNNIQGQTVEMLGELGFIFKYGNLKYEY